MKINYGQILVMVLAILFTGAMVKIFLQEDPEYNTYLIITEEKKFEYIHTPDNLFLKDSSGCVTNGKKIIRCGVKHLSLEKK